MGEEFPLECPACGGDIRLIAFITEPGPIRKILTHLGEPLEPPPISPARGPPTDQGELVHVHFRPRRLSGLTRRAARSRHPQPLTAAASQVTTKPPGRRTRRDSAHKPETRHSRGEGRRAGKGLVRIGSQEHATHEPLISRAMLAAVPLAGLSLPPHQQSCRIA
jgi:hypothetical protein